MFKFGRGKKKRAKNTKKVSPKKTEDKKTEEKGSEESVKKPWGKSERYLVIGTLLTTLIISGVLAIYSRSWKLPNLPRLKLSNDAFEGTFVIENSEKSKDNQEIIKEFSELTNGLSGVYGFAVVNLNDNTKYGKFQNEKFQAASLIKLPLMTYVYELAEDYRLSLDSIHTLTESDKVGGSGSLYYEDVGTVRTIRELVEAMGKQSDNTAYNILKGKVGEEDFQKYIDEIGMTETNVATNETTVTDIASFFVKLWENRLVNKDHRDELLEYLTDTVYENYLPSKLPDGVRVAHKYGRELHVINDAGIVYADHPFVIVLLTKGVVEREAEEIFADLARVIYDYETNR